MSHFAQQKQCGYQENKERQDICHDAEQSVTYIMNCLAKASGRIHYNGYEKKKTKSKKRYAPDNVYIPLVAVASALHLLKDFLLCRIGCL